MGPVQVAARLEKLTGLDPGLEGSVTQTVCE